MLMNIFLPIYSMHLSYVTVGLPLGLLYLVLLQKTVSVFYLHSFGISVQTTLIVFGLIFFQLEVVVDPPYFFDSLLNLSWFYLKCLICFLRYKHFVGLFHWSRGHHAWLLIINSKVQFPVLPNSKCGLGLQRGPPSRLRTIG